MRFGLDGWDPSKPRAVGTENFDAVVDRDASGVVLVRRMFGSGFDEVLSRSDASGVRWYGTDRLGTVHEWFDAAGVRVGAVVQFDGYGTVVSGALADRYGFTGREWDSVVGLQYSRARMYSPTQGRFTSEDPLGLRAGDANFYRYVGNQPTGRIDPSGYDWLERFQDGWDHLGKGFQELPAASERAADRFGERLDNLAHGRLNPDFVNGVQKLIDDPAKNFPKLGEIIVDDLTKAPRKLGEGLVTGDGRKIVEGAAGTGLMYFGAKQAGELVCRDSDKFLKFLKSEKGTYPNVPRTGGPQAPTTVRPSVNSSLPDRVTQELPTGGMRTPAEVKQTRNFFERNREAAERWWSERNGGKPWPENTTHAEHPRPIKDGGDPLFIEPGFNGSHAPHMIPGADGLTDFQRWGKLGGRPPKK